MAPFSVLIEVLATRPIYFPEPIWYVPLLVGLVLGYAAVVDARTGSVPAWALLIALFGSFFAVAYFSGWMLALERAVPVVAFGFALAVLNGVCVKAFGHDVFGMGDVQWTAAATFTFGLVPVLWSWGAGACLALLWLGARKLMRKIGNQYQGHMYVHFVPFLFLALCGSLFVLGFQPA